MPPAPRVTVSPWLLFAMASLGMGCTAHPQVLSPAKPAPSGSEWLLGTDQVRLYWSARRPAGEPRAVVYFVLGPEVSSAPLYPRLSEALVTRGYVLVTVHARGSGYSDGLRGDIQDYSRFLGDLELGLQRARDEFPRKPIFLFGHSAGATLALEVASNAESAIQGIVLVNPAYKLHYGEGMGPSFGDYLAFAFNSLFRPAALTVDMNSNPSAAKFAPDREEGEALAKDPLVVRYFSLRMLSAQRRVMQRAPENIAKVKAPVLLVQGRYDALVDPSGNDELLAKAQSKDKQRIIAPLGGHGSSAVETMVEPLAEWLDSRCPTPSL